MPSVRDLLLTALISAPGVCVLLLVRLHIRTRQLARANRELERRNAELQAAAQAKRRFVANLSHELRNPLNAVLGFAELMDAGRAGGVSERQHEHLGIIRDSAEHILSLSTELLDEARMEAGRIMLSPEPVAPARLACTCIRSLAGLAHAHDVRVDLDPHPVQTVALDPSRLRQVILNLVSNAIKFSSRGEVVTVSLAWQDGRLQLTVSDHGPGIASDDQARIFEEFFQVPGSEGLGTGLGLAVTRSIVHAQGGSITVASELGAGAAFTVVLPAPSADRLQNAPERSGVRLGTAGLTHA